MSIAEFAQEHGVTSNTVARFIRTGQIASVQTKWVQFQRSIIDSSSVTLPSKSPGKIYGLGMAAKLIGIPRRVLRELKASGDFEVNHSPRIMAGVHELDVQAFSEKLISLAPTQRTNNPMPENFMEFNRITSSHYGPYSRILVKANIIRLLLSKELPVIGCIDGTVGGLLVSKQDLLRCTITL
jgi:hypothetical protein